ncbi:response regulator [Actinoplanes sp. NPDC051346]|uniref:response regulator n=1 Tax=Actinoplanes sp. NPDC051346 TaxID=3155048 RepID=UPI00341218B0
MPTVLLGESVPELRALFAKLFERAGDTVHTAGDSAEVIRLATDMPPDLVVLNLPEDDGPATCRALRADPRTADTPILLLSAALYPDAATALQAGADDYMTKPLQNADLIQHAHSLTTAESCPHPGAEPSHTRSGKDVATPGSVAPDGNGFAGGPPRLGGYAGFNLMGPGMRGPW